MAIWDAELKNSVLSLIKAHGGEVIKGADDRIEFSRKAPLRTFRVIREDGRLLVKETTGFRAFGRVQPTPYRPGQRGGLPMIVARAEQHVP